jgi:hypothetical protein
VAIFWSDDEVPVCDATGEPVDECDHAYPYDEIEEADMRLHQELKEADCV